jgi:ornithine decarboxylase
MAPSAITVTEEQHASITLNQECLTSVSAHCGSENARDLVLGMLKNNIAAIDTDGCEAGDEDAFFVADLGDVYRQHLRWKNLLKRVKPHYGV